MKTPSPTLAHAATALTLLLPLLPAQQLSYTTSLITICDPPSSAAAAAPPPAPAPTQLTVTMPSCPSCDCATCAHTSVFTATYAVFCPGGTTRQAYTATEVYRGMATFPVLATPTGVPFGFTTGVETCSACGGGGGAPLVAAMTYPSGGRPYVSGMAVPAEGAGSDVGAGGAAAGGGAPVTAGAAWVVPAGAWSVVCALFAVVF